MGFFLCVCVYYIRRHNTKPYSKITLETGQDRNYTPVHDSQRPRVPRNTSLPFVPIVTRRPRLRHSCAQQQGVGWASHNLHMIRIRRRSTVPSAARENAIAYPLHLRPIARILVMILMPPMRRDGGQEGGPSPAGPSAVSPLFPRCDAGRCCPGRRPAAGS